MKRFIIITKKNIIITLSSKEFKKLRDKYHKKWIAFYGARYEGDTLIYQTHLNHNPSWVELAKEFIRKCGG